MQMSRTPVVYNNNIIHWMMSGICVTYTQGYKERCFEGLEPLILPQRHGLV